ncbi:CHD5-like protein [Musa troglodytarum]|uniref:CHD5-like protein n=1 Tax=Musa troglodytarum TaxID=320322 RepID=A0A9E7KMP6_9LILI|nr:CHD5-like protein [Musa troglodytarum]
MPVGSLSSRPRSRHLLLLRHRRFNHDPRTPVASRMNGGTSGSGSGSLSPLFIFFLVGVLQILDGLLDFVKRKGMHSAEEVQLRKEIKQLLKEASSLSTPSTFAQSAKLRRLAAAKEKELLRKQEEHRKEKSWFYELCGRVLLVIKVLLYATLVLQFWGVPVAAVPHHLLQPFGKIFIAHCSPDVEIINIVYSKKWASGAILNDIVTFTLTFFHFYQMQDIVLESWKFCYRSNHGRDSSLADFNFSRSFVKFIEYVNKETEET